MVEARWVALGVLTVARLSMAVQFQTFASAAPLLMDTLGIGYAEVGFLIGLYMLPGVVLALPSGWLGQRVSDKAIVVAGLVLMVAGGLLTGFAQSHSALLAGRLVSGVGGVLLNVAMTKMIADWFAGREIVLAMTIFINSFPAGIGLALLGLGWLAEVAGAAAVFHAGTLAAVAALALVVLGYRPHGADAATADAGAGGGISGREVALVALAGVIWGVFNGAFTITLAFTPMLLIAAGTSLAGAGLVVGAATWLVVASVQAGGVIAHRWAHRPGARDLLLVGGMAGWGAGLLALPSVEPLLALTLIGAALGLPAGIITSLPAEILRPRSRAIGMGIFYSFLYAGHTGLPPLAGRIQDAVGGTSAALYATAALVLSVIPLYALVRWAQRR